MDYSKIILNKGKEFSLQRHHPWVFSGAIAKKDNNLKDPDSFAKLVSMVFIAFI